jgi:RNA recognition motif-containing protein
MIETMESRTTVMLRNLPNNYTREMMLSHLDGLGFAGLYNFFYMPIDFTSEASLGYAFVNFATPRDAQLLMAAFDGFSDWVIPTRKRCYVNWSHPHQGLASNIERYRNSPVMHKDVPDVFKPAVFDHGMRVEFPAPTRRLRCPRLRGVAITHQSSS